MNLKKIIIIGAYPNSSEKAQMLSDCVDNLSGIGYDLMIVSHYPVPISIQEKVDFVIYDKENILDPYESTPVYFYQTNNFSVEIKSRGHIMTVCRNINNGLNLAKNLGYDFFFFLEFDNLIHKNDILLLNILHYEMLINDKKMIFFHQKIENQEIYESLIFAGTPSFFLENAVLPLHVNDFKKIEMELTLEKSFFSQFKKFENDLLLIDKPSNLFFKNSLINKIAHYSKIDIIKDITHNRFLLWISNSINNENDLIIKINEGEPFSLGTDGWIMKPIQVGENIKIEVNENGFIYIKELELTEENQNEYSNKNTIIYY